MPIAGKTVVVQKKLFQWEKIQSWKASHMAVEADEHYHEQFENLVKHSFFNMVSNTFVLEREYFFERPLKN